MYTSCDGLRINVIPLSFAAKLKLADHVCVSDQFRADTDLWLLAMFGAKDTTPLPRGTVAASGRHLTVQADDYQALKDALKAPLRPG